MLRSASRNLMKCCYKNLLIDKRVCSRYLVQSFGFSSGVPEKKLHAKMCSSLSWTWSRWNEYSKTKSNRNFTAPMICMGLGFSLFGLFQKDEVNMTVVKIHQARIAHEELKYEEAERLYHEALFLLIDERKSLAIEENDFLVKRTVVINGLANLALIFGKVREAEELFKDCMKGMLLCGMEQTDNAIVEASLKLSNVYAQQKRFPQAIAGYKFCVKTQEKKVLEMDSKALDVDTLALYGLSLDNYARFLISRKEFTEAEKCLKQALKVSEELTTMGEDIAQTMLVILNNLATVFLERNDYEHAAENMEKAVSLAEKSKMPELAAYYCNLGSVYIYKERFEEAAQLCQKSKKLAAKQKDKHTESMADVCLKELENHKPNCKSKSESCEHCQ